MNIFFQMFYRYGISIRQINKLNKQNREKPMKKAAIPSQNDDSSDEDTEISRKKRCPVIDPFKKIKSKGRKHIYINLSSTFPKYSVTRYEVIQDVAYELGWHVQTSLQKGDWDIFWTDHVIDTDVLMRMHLFQKISHFPGIHVLARKNLLGYSLNEMKKKFPEEYNFFPETWLLPSNYSELRADFQQNRDKDKTYIVKPEADCQGRGIFLTNKIQDVENGKHYVVQEYITRPYLIEGLKFDFRVYVLLCGTNPMRLYVYEEGLARFATEKYTEPSSFNMKKTCIHLTNYAINKKNPKYVFNSSDKNMGVGHKRSLTSVLSCIQRRGDDVQKLKQRIDSLIVETFIVGLPLVSHQYKYCQPEDESRNICFHILGIDIMLDQDCNPILLEVNHTPSFATDTPLDYKIKFELIRDSLVLMNVNSKSKREMMAKAQFIRDEKAMTNTVKKQLYQNQEMRARVKEAQRKRDQYEDEHLGKYRKVFPVEDPELMESYQKFIDYADKAYFSENNVLRTQIQLEKNAALKQEKKSQSPMKLPSPVRLAKKALSLSQKASIETDKIIPGANIFDVPRRQSALMTGIKAFGSCKIESLKVHGQRPREFMKIEDEIANTMRMNVIKKLPRLESSSTINSSALELKRRQFFGFRRKKIMECSDTFKDILLARNQSSPERGSGAYLAPKTIEFRMDILNSKRQKVKKMEEALSFI